MILAFWRSNATTSARDLLLPVPSLFCNQPFLSELQERRLARKREDFEKMKEISLHMDNIVQRLSTFFPRDDKETGKDCRPPHPPVPPEVPALPLPPPDKAVDRSASARVMTMDRAVSARRLTTDRAVSVASGLHFDDDLSGATTRNRRRRG